MISNEIYFMFKYTNISRVTYLEWDSDTMHYEQDRPSECHPKIFQPKYDQL